MKTKTKIKKRQIDTGTLHRTFSLNRKEVDEEKRTVAIAFSSEEPVERWFGNEVLSHEKSAVDLGRLNDGGALLVDHDPSDHVGVIEKATIDSDKVGRAIVRFGQGARAQEIFQDVLDGIRSKISVGYRIHEMLEDRKTETYTATRWQPHEVSFVSIPADASVGVGRSQRDNSEKFITNILTEERIMKLFNENGDQIDEDGKIIKTRAQIDAEKNPAPKTAPEFDIEAERKKILKDEQKRTSEIRALGKEHGLETVADEAIANGDTVEAATRSILDNIKDSKPLPTSPSEIGLTDKEARSFSMIRALNALANPNNRKAQEMAAFEIECSNAVAANRGASPQGMFVPENGRSGFVNRAAPGKFVNGIAVPHEVTRADLSAGTVNTGQELVAENLLAGSFIDVLRNLSAVAGMGATMMSDLVGDVAIPRKTAGSTAAWITTEGGDASQSDPTFDQVTLTPKTAGVYTEVTRQLLLQSSLDVEALIRNDLAAGMATLLDAAALYGTGSNGQPQGISTGTGVNTPTAFAAAVPTFLEIIAMESAVATDNALMGALGYMTEAAMRGSLKGTLKAANSGMFVWENGNMVNGYNATVTNQVTSGDVFFGNWSDLLIGAWGGLDLLVDPYTGGKAGTVRVIAHQSIDVAMRHGESFCFNNDT